MAPSASEAEVSVATLAAARRATEGLDPVNV
jgi:hypothetical protein